MNRMMAIVEREMRKFFRSPALMMVSMTLPLVQLLILGNAFGGKIRNARMGVVDHDRGAQALKIHEAFDAIAANIRTFTTVPYDDEVKAREDVRTGKIDGAVIIPRQYSRRVLAGDSPAIGLVVDNTDQVMSASLEAEMQSLVEALNAPIIQPLVVQKIAVKIVELYPYVEYMKYLLAGSIALAMYVAVMIGGGMLYIDDKARGVHEGYLVTPITRLELVMGLNLAGSIKAILSGVCLTVIGSLLRRHRSHLQSHGADPALAAHRRHLGRLQRHDVPDDGARRRSARPPRHVRRPQHAALLPQRSHLPGLGTSTVAARHRQSSIPSPTPSTASRPSCSRMEASPPSARTSSSSSPSESAPS